MGFLIHDVLHSGHSYIFTLFSEFSTVGCWQHSPKKQLVVFVYERNILDDKVVEKPPCNYDALW